MHLMGEKHLNYTWSDTVSNAGVVPAYCLSHMHAELPYGLKTSFIPPLLYVFSSPTDMFLFVCRLHDITLPFLLRLLNRKRPLQTTVRINQYNLLAVYTLSSASHETCLCDMKRPAGNRATMRCRREMSM